MPMPKPVCRTNMYNKIVQLEVRRTFSGRGMGINGTAQLLWGANPGSRAGTLPARVAIYDNIVYVHTAGGQQFGLLALKPYQLCSSPHLTTSVFGFRHVRPQFLRIRARDLNFCPADVCVYIYIYKVCIYIYIYIYMSICFYRFLYISSLTQNPKP